MEKLHTALHLKDDWSCDVVDKLKDYLSRKGTISDLLTDLSIEIKEEEFGEVKGGHSLSDYEMKLLYFAFTAGRCIEKITQDDMRFFQVP